MHRKDHTHVATGIMFPQLVGISNQRTRIKATRCETLRTVTTND